VADADWARARRLLAAPPAGAGAAWTCARCGEDNPGSFDLCWHCGAGRA